MEIDNAKLISLIEARPAIYNHNMKEHSDYQLVLGLWTEVAENLNCTVPQCKQKWGTLRNAYARCVRKTMTGFKRKRKWYLENRMSFLKDFMQCQVPTANAYTNNLSLLLNDNDSKSLSLNSEEDSVSQKANINTADSTYGEPLIDIGTDVVPEDPMVLFIKSLLPDINTLHVTQRREFRDKIYQLLNEYLQNQNRTEPEDLRRIEHNHGFDLINYKDYGTLL